MRILITGGLGYIGGRLAKYLSTLDCTIILASRKFYSKSPVWLPEAEMVQIDWNSDNSIMEAVSDVDYVVHSAGMNAKDCESDPVAAIGFNALCTAMLVRAVENSNVHKFIYLSTAHVYSSYLDGLITEEICPRNLHPYATSHRAAEDAVLWANSIGKLNGVVLRISNAIGAPVDKNVNCWMLLFNDLCRQAVENKYLCLTSSGVQKRDFIAMSSVTKVIEFFINDKNNLNQSVFNCGSGISLSVNDAAKIIQERFLIKYGVTLKITKPPNAMLDIPEQQDILQYTSVNMGDYQMTSNNDLIDEIDSLIDFCEYNFS